MDLLNKTQMADYTPAVTTAVEEGVALPLLFSKTLGPPSEPTQPPSQ
jgi:hypothetical protein